MVVGLGYVGLPLAVALARHGEVVGFDVDASRIDELGRGHDRTREVEPDALAASSLTLTADPADCVGADIYIVTVPTPIDAHNEPDLAPPISARAIAGWIDRARRPTIVYESTVYPSVTEDVCGPSHLAQKVGLHPQVVLAGCDTNDAMGSWIADRLHELAAASRGTRW